MISEHAYADAVDIRFMLADGRIVSVQGRLGRIAGPNGPFCGSRRWILQRFHDGAQSEL